MQEEGTIHNNVRIWYTNFPMPQAMKMPGAKAAVDKEWEKLDKIPAWDLTKFRKKGRKVHFASLVDICHS